jgi:hypothetical protein
MRESPITRAKASSPIVRAAWASAGAICLFTVENVWIDPWLARRSHHRLLSLVPEALGGTWLLVLLALAITLTLAVFCQVLLIRDARLSGWKKVLTGIPVLAATILAAEWFVATGGMTMVQQVHPHRRDHTVKLHWQASTTKNVRYNIYRGPKPGFHPNKLNSSPIDGLTFTDTTAQNGTKYYYVARAVDDATGHESSDSNEAFANVP